MSLTLRNTKGSKLTFTEMDDNFTYLDNKTGTEGPQGATGPQGPQGSTGADSNVAGPQGPQGTAGSNSNVAGPQGPQGSTGADSNVAGPQGPIGSTGVIDNTQYVRNTTDTYTGTDKIAQIITLSQAEYDVISTKSDATLYIIL